MSLDVHVRNILDQMASLKLPKLWEIGPQAARAASLTVPDDRLLHSLHGYFLRGGQERQETERR